MVTVATSLDVPIKLVFPGPKRGSMLGLGDVVLPGIMMALALRFDLYLHYVRMQTTKSQSTTQSATPDTGVPSPSQIVVKAPYIEATGSWGERFWTRNVKLAQKPDIARGGQFSKVYFNATVVGYLVGIIATLVVLNIYNHAQPALLYLVPGVLIAVWGTALVRGEINLMWNYTEDGSLEDESKEGDKSKTGKEEKPGSNAVVQSDGGNKADGAIIKEKKDDHARHVFLFSLSSPKSGGVARKAKLFDKTA